MLDYDDAVCGQHPLDEPLVMKFDGGKLPLLCPKCYYILGWANGLDDRPTYRELLWREND